MDTEFFSKMQNIHSFVELQSIFESWINEGVINEKSSELQIGYTSLITYPSIYLTKDNAKKEIAAAKNCYDILIEYAKDTIKEDLISDNEKTRDATKLMLIPPEKVILTMCSEFFHLHYFLKGLYSSYTDEQLACVNGDDYAKVWLNIFSKGYHFEPTENNYNTDRSHFNEALIMISKMHLSPEYKEKIDIENIKPQFSKYYHINNNNSGSGCLVSSIMLFVTSLLIACNIL